MIYDHPMKLARSIQKACARLKTLGYSTGALRAGDAAYFNVTTPQGRYYEVIVREVPVDEQIENNNKSSESVRAALVELGAAEYDEVVQARRVDQKATPELKARLEAARSRVKPRPSASLRAATAVVLQANAHLAHDSVDYAEWLLREWAHQVMPVNVPPAEVTDRANLRRMTRNVIQDYAAPGEDAALSDKEARNIALLREWLDA